MTILIPVAASAAATFLLQLLLFLATDKKVAVLAFAPPASAATSSFVMVTAVGMRFPPLFFSSSSTIHLKSAPAFPRTSSSTTALAYQQEQDQHDTTPGHCRQNNNNSLRSNNKNNSNLQMTKTVSVAIVLLLAFTFLFSSTFSSLWSAITAQSSTSSTLQLQEAAISLWDITLTVQRIGENAFAATLVVAALQAILALVQYRTNPMGQLAVPPGLTIGVEYPPSAPNNNDQQNQKTASAAAARRTLSRIRDRRRKADSNKNEQNAATAAARDRGGWWSKWKKRTTSSSRRSVEEVVTATMGTTTTSAAAAAAATLEKVVNQKQPQPPLPLQVSSSSSSSSSSLLENKNSTAVTLDSCLTLSSRSSSCLVHSKQQSRYSIIMNRINQFLFLLLPWIAQRAGYIIQEKVHLFHIAFIMGMATLLDFPAYFFLTQQIHHHSGNNNNHKKKQQQEPEEVAKTNGVQPWSSRLTSTTTSRKTSTTTTSNGVTMSRAASPSPKMKNSMIIDHEKMMIRKNLKRIVVIGDSLAVGLGCVDIFDRNRNNTLDYCRIENVNPPPPSQQQEQQLGDDAMSSRSVTSSNISPVFPKRLAQRLAQRLNKPIHWRSAGVDGGASAEITKFCVPMIREMVQNDKTPPDVVVILGGINDLKASFSPSGGGGAGGGAAGVVSNKQDGNHHNGNHHNANTASTTTTTTSSKMLGGKMLGGPRLYRQRLAGLCTEILTLAPNATVVLPAIPTQMFHKHSPLNIFPLALVLDALVAFWDSQKKLVADSFGGDWLHDDEKPRKNDVVYIGISAQDVARWYKPRHQRKDIFSINGDDDTVDNEDYDDDDDENEANEDDITLLAIDGVHPNKRCYARWAETVADRLLDYFEHQDND